MMTFISTRAELIRLLAQGLGPHHVYVLRKPDDIEAHGGLGTPFYVGKGQDAARAFEHEKEARDPLICNSKIATIRAIWSEGKEVVRTIDSFHNHEPWDREEELINSIGCIFDGTGPLTNAQRYSRSDFQDGVQLRKYAMEQRAAGGVDQIPANFKLRYTRLKAGPNEPRSLTNVMRKVYATTKANPGVTGEELVGLLAQLDFSGHGSAYTQSGQVCAAWLCGYITGAYARSDTKFIQDFLL